MRPALLSEPADALPSHPGRGLAGAFALHAGVAAVLVAATLLGVRQPPLGVVPATVGRAVVLVPPPPPVLVRTGPSLEAVASIPPSSGVTTADGFRYDTSHIREHRQLLFPFLTGALPFLAELRATADVERTRLRNPLGVGSARRNRATPPLRLTDRARETLVDRTWSRRDRWKSLGPIVDLARRYDGDQGALPLVVRDHVERNLLQLYVEGGAPDPRFWVMLGLAADHADVVEFVGQYAREHPSSRTTIELLFLLDELAEASRGAFGLLMDTNIEALAHTRSSSPQDAQLAWQLQRGYESWARSRELDRPEALDARFDAVRTSILQTIIDISPDGYGTADARFLAGRLRWDRSDITGAVEWWRGMPRDTRRTDERTIYAGVRAEIGQALQADGGVDVVRIVKALASERSRWLRESTERLERFGFTPATF
jgi:hypothetical protein